MKRLLFGFGTLLTLSIQANPVTDAPIKYHYSNEETRIKIVVIDSGLKLTPEIKPYLCKDLAISTDGDSPFTKVADHGTNVAGLIAEQIDPTKACLVIVKYWAQNVLDTGLIDSEIMGIEYAIKIQAQFINMSLQGADFSAAEYDIIARALRMGIKISVASGNNRGNAEVLDANGFPVLTKNAKGQTAPLITAAGADLSKKCDVYPACLQFNSELFHVVGTSTGYKNDWGGNHFYGNYGKPGMYYEDGTLKGFPAMTGTSQATAIHTGKWAAGKIK